MGATQRLAVPAPTVLSPSLARCAPSLCTRAKRGEDGSTVRVFAWRTSTVLYALACVALAVWTACFLWEVSAADVLPGGPDFPVREDDASLEKWLELHVETLGIPHTAGKSRGEGGRRGRARDLDTNKAVVSPESESESRERLLPMNRNLELLPAYAYRDALADRTTSNVLDVARIAADDRRARRAFIPRNERPVSNVSKERAEDGSVEATPLPPPKRVVATHHKTGTALMHDVFNALLSQSSSTEATTGKRHDKYGAFIDLRDMEDHPEAFPKDAFANARTNAGVVLDYHLGKVVPEFFLHPSEGSSAKSVSSRASDARTRDDLLGLPFALTSVEDAEGETKNEPYRMVHVVRDPVEVLISGYLYHRRLPANEGWLFEPARGANGKSHAELLRTAEKSPKRAMEAELQMADDELRMLVLAYRQVDRDPNALNVKLESFFYDFDGTVEKVLRFLRFDEEDIPEMVETAKTFDTRRWSEEERSVNEHFTGGEDREPYKRAIAADPFLNKTTSYMRYAMEYGNRWPEFDPD